LDSFLKITAITGGHNEPSARFRVRQYINELTQYNIQVTECLPFISKSGDYWYHKYGLPIQLIPQMGTACLRIASRIPAVLTSYKSDITWIQREFLTATSTIEGLTNSPRIFDVDDAIWLRLKFTSGFAKKIAQKTDGVICGNNWIADHFAECNIPTWVVPTGIDTKRWQPGQKIEKEFFYLGWMGTSGNYKYLYEIEKPLYSFLNKYKKIKLLVVADKKPTFSRLKRTHFDFIPWAKDIEVPAMQKMDIGLMPLSNSDWERGKCAFKMLLYMSTGIPVVASPVGMNKEVLNKGSIGFGPISKDEWTDAFNTLYNDYSLREYMGKTGRKIIINNYSTKIISMRLSNIFHEIA